MGRVLLSVLGLGIIAWGIVMLKWPDVAWSVTKWENDSEGRVSERNGTWEDVNIFGGIFCIVFGIAFLLFALLV